MTIAVAGVYKKISATFASNGSPSDPATINCRIENPDKTIDTYDKAAFQNPEAGSYWLNHQFLQSGWYTVQIEGISSTSSIKLKGFIFVHPAI